MSLLTILYALFGACLGSYVHATGGRLFVSINSARSKCLSCGHVLGWYDLIPIFSYIMRRGRCKYCKSKFEISHLVYEVIGATLFAVLYQYIISGFDIIPYGLIFTLYYSLLFICFGLIAHMDIKHRAIPTKLLYSFIVLAVLMFAYRLVSDLGNIEILLAPLLALPFLILSHLTREKYFGAGDSYLLLGVGFFYPVVETVSVLLYSLWLGAIFALLTVISSKGKYTGKSAIAFAPFIILAFLIVLFTDFTIIELVEYLQSYIYA